ncbi:MAG: hypothetical protein R8J85_01655 [Mariprofundales bacterium]
MKQQRSYAEAVRILVIASILMIAGCGNSGGGSTATTTTHTITVTVADGISGTVVSGVTVQLDQAGATATTNASGVATFSGASTGNHDIHIFPSATSGYQWESIYQTSATNIKWDLSKNDISYAEYSGTVTNLGVGDSLVLLLEDASATNTVQSFSKVCTVTGTNYTCSIKADGIPVGSTGSFNLWALEVNGSNSVVDGVKLQDKANYTVTSTAKGGAANAQNITLSTTLPAATTLITVSTVTPPAGITLGNTVAAMPLPFDVTMGISSVLGNPITAYNPFATTSPVWAWSGGKDSAGNLAWAIIKKSTIGATNIALKSSFTALPAIAAQNGQGATNPTISFTPAQGTFTGHLVTIDESVTGRTLWNITAPTTATSITLPSLPTGVTAILSTGTVYNLWLFGMEISGGTSYNSLVSGSYDPTLVSYSDLEWVQAPTVTFTR